MALRKAPASAKRLSKVERLTELPPEIAAWGRPHTERRQDIDYIEKHFDELMRRYPEEWIAVYEQHVVAHAKRHADMWRQVKKLKLVDKSPVDYFLGNDDFYLK